MSVSLSQDEITALNDCLLLPADRKLLNGISEDLNISIVGMSDIEAHFLLRKNALSLKREVDRFVENSVEPLFFTEIKELSKDELIELRMNITLILFELTY
ncbi:hypothetical protein [Halobacteriovorax sp. JY17]|uniref:hypothetical protein n=1 Tax=Halobacteriovorax sp. JY17 TaxID=2014617 RepID=UPI000C419CA8|nr:hypothetical protein [Halobacteriovorax sp. JY17]PIK15104.1 MAG: hypothetical protein CES88_12280 [Halobacteriovorax sp. JY17]